MRSHRWDRRGNDCDSNYKRLSEVTESLLAASDGWIDGCGTADKKRDEQTRMKEGMREEGISDGLKDAT